MARRPGLVVNFFDTFVQHIAEHSAKETIHVFQLVWNRKNCWFMSLLILGGCSRSDDRATSQPSKTGAAAPAVAASTGKPLPDAQQQVVSQGVSMQPFGSRVTSQEDSAATVFASPVTSGTPSATLEKREGATDLAGVKSIPLLETGATAPDFMSVDLAGKEVHLSDWRDRIVVLDFWATWCGPCLASLPHLQEMAALCVDKNVTVFAICTSDTRDKFEQFVEANQNKYPNIVFACDPHERGGESFDERASLQLFGVSNLPTQFVIGPDGKITAVLTGYEKDEHRLEDALGELGVQLGTKQSQKDSR